MGMRWNFLFIVLSSKLLINLISLFLENGFGNISMIVFLKSFAIVECIVLVIYVR